MARMISIIVPSSWREERLQILLENLEQQCEAMPGAGVEIIVPLDYGRAEADPSPVLELMACWPSVRFLFSLDEGCWRATNLGIGYATNELIGWTADDALPHPGALKAGVDRFHLKFPDGLGLLVFNDLQHEGQVAGHALTTKSFLRLLYGQNGFPDFDHWYCDTLTADRARDLGRLHYAKDIIWEHQHWTVGKAERDRLNDANEVGEKKLRDKALKDRLDLEWIKNGYQLAVGKLAIAARFPSTGTP
jgi:hypothetical protein